MSINLWVKDSDGNPSVIVTLVILSFIVTSTAYLLAVVNTIGAVSIRPFDPLAAGSYFGAVLAAWTGHKWVNSKYEGANATVTAQAAAETAAAATTTATAVASGTAVIPAAVTNVAVFPKADPITSDSQPLPPTDG